MDEDFKSQLLSSIGAMLQKQEDTINLQLTTITKEQTAINVKLEAMTKEIREIRSERGLFSGNH